MHGIAFKLETDRKLFAFLKLLFCVMFIGQLFNYRLSQFENFVSIIIYQYDVYCFMSNGLCYANQSTTPNKQNSYI